MSYVKPREEFTSYVKPNYLKTSVGQHLIRVLDTADEAYVVKTHWFGMSVKCPGENCPQCNQNRKIRAENPDTYQKISGYRPATERYFVNVLDRSDVKICENCKTEVVPVNNQFPTICPSCGTMIVTVTPTSIEQVRILNKGRELFEQLDALDTSILDKDGNRPGITGFDVVIMVSSPKAKPIVIPTQRMDVVSVPADAKYNLKSLVPEVSEDEMTQLMRGVQVKDIFAARRAVNPTPAKTEVPPSSLEDIQNKINELF